MAEARGQRTPHRRRRRFGAAGPAGAVLGCLVLLAACVVEPTEIASSVAETSTPTEPSPTAPPPPTPTPVPPTPTAPPPPTATPTTPPTPTPRPVPTSIPPIIPGPDNEPSILTEGPVSFPVAGTTSVRLDQPRPVLILPGHTLIYVDPDREAEVDIFTPIADGLGEPFTDYEAVADYLTSDPAFVDVPETDSATVAGFPARVFQGLPVTGERGFYTDASTIGNDSAGWFPPVRLRLWLIDTPNGPLVITAESLFDPGQFPEANRMVRAFLQTLRLSP
ncbi:MAG: hypothetical protein AAF567_23945 [Actinomycetota bacterium]